MLRASSKWARCTSLVFLLEFLLFSIALAMPSREDFRDQFVPDNAIPASQLRFSNSPSVQEAHSKRKDFFFPNLTQSTKRLNLVQTLIAAMIPRTPLSSEAINSPVENGMRSLYQVGYKDESRSNRRLLRGPRGSSYPGHFWHVEQHLQRREVFEANSNPPPAVDQQMQQFLFGPPAPPGLIHNEKQDWNQDYAEPDVHPPSSN